LAWKLKKGGVGDEYDLEMIVARLEPCKYCAVELLSLGLHNSRVVVASLILAQQELKLQVSVDRSHYSHQ